ncbi:acyltransferase family protein [Tundrisphaera lichenicola]|uniref:acyltransferase family protein n=1 Tax=Tundrisphaera lichenicola TaxID=2029860 RepID=UPI003EBF4476
MRRVPELDALRGLAAVVVLLFHLDPPRYFPGWSGVDLFFVLSGYLITSIILKNAGTSGFYPRFYARRSIRIWPIYYLTLLVLIVANFFSSEDVPMNDLPYALTFTQNISLYWGKYPPANHPATNHLWTLAVEEQFYLIWPALVLWAGRRRLVPLCLLAISIALASRDGYNWFLPKYHDRLLIARCDGFALGGILAWLLDEGGWARLRPDLGNRAFGATVGLVVLYFAWGMWAEGPIGFVGLPTPSHPAETIFAFGLLYAGVVGLVALNAGNRWLLPLRLRWLAYLGQISYGIYLYHYVVYWFIDGCRTGIAIEEGQRWPTQALKLGVTLIVAIASWHLIERPILGLKDRFRYRDP